MGEHWSKKYLGIPFKEGGRCFSGCDCGGLVLLVLKGEQGLTPSDFTEYEKADFRGRRMKRLSDGVGELLFREWTAVERPAPFDLLLFRVGSNLCHVGICAGDSAFLHVEEANPFARITRLADLAWGKRLVAVYRHKDLYGGAP